VDAGNRCWALSSGVAGRNYAGLVATTIDGKMVSCNSKIVTGTVDSVEIDGPSASSTEACMPSTFYVACAPQLGNRSCLQYSLISLSMSHRLHTVNCELQEREALGCGVWVRLLRL
jgi:hypothetical protein